MLRIRSVVARWNTAPADISNDFEHEHTEESFSLSEFARLPSMLTNNENARKAVIDRGRTRTQKAIDQHVNKDAFWLIAVVPLFNNLDDVELVDFKGMLSGIDRSAMPRTERSGPDLRRYYLEVCAQFI